MSLKHMAFVTLTQMLHISRTIYLPLMGRTWQKGLSVFHNRLGLWTPTFNMP